MGAAQAMQQFATFEGELDRVHGEQVGKSARCRGKSRVLSASKNTPSRNHYFRSLFLTTDTVLPLFFSEFIILMVPVVSDLELIRRVPSCFVSVSVMRPAGR